MRGFPKVNRRGMFSYDGGPVTSRSQLKRREAKQSSLCSKRNHRLLLITRRASLFTVSRSFTRVRLYDTSMRLILFASACTNYANNNYYSDVEINRRDKYKSSKIRDLIVRIKIFNRYFIYF